LSLLHLSLPSSPMRTMEQKVGEKAVCWPKRESSELVTMAFEKSLWRAINVMSHTWHIICEIPSCFAQI
jgi:hypothetical protein